MFEYLLSCCYILAKSSSPSARRKGLVKDEFYPRDQEIEPGSDFRIGVNDFDFIRVIGRGSYAKVMMVWERFLLTNLHKRFI